SSGRNSSSISKGVKKIMTMRFVRGVWGTNCLVVYGQCGRTLWCFQYEQPGCAQANRVIL
ncbi:hypothetical protein, partial [Acetobacter lovaniensis]|uniref:hypothetical protein n=1 Tax=Acetobacter lovaniensis TaxID=104100 RepID=UPI0022305C9B